METNDRAAWLEKHHWITFLLPFVVYMALGAIEPSPGNDLASYGRAYAITYTFKIALTIATMAFVWPGYRKFPLRVSKWAILTGLVGGPLWIGLCLPNVEHAYVLPALEKVGLGSFIGAGDRPGFNSFDPKYDLSAAAAWFFMVIRFTGLVVVVPVIEEFFLRGFVMRFVMKPDWWNVPFGTASRLAIVAGTVLPMLSHSGELLAAAVWFSMVTWLMLRTKNIWDCIVAHSLTNLILGVYVVSTGTWRLW